MVKHNKDLIRKYEACRLLELRMEEEKEVRYERVLSKLKGLGKFLGLFYEGYERETGAIFQEIERGCR